MGIGSQKSLKDTLSQGIVLDEVLDSFAWNPQVQPNLTNVQNLSEATSRSRSLGIISPVSEGTFSVSRTKVEEIPTRQPVCLVFTVQRGQSALQCGDFQFFFWCV